MFDALNTTVEKGAHKRGVASFAVGCTIDSKRDIDKFEVAFPDIPGSPLAVWVEENGEALRSLDQKVNGKKITESGGTPPPFSDFFRDWGF